MALIFKLACAGQMLAIMQANGRFLQPNVVVGGMMPYLALSSKAVNISLQELCQSRNLLQRGIQSSWPGASCPIHLQAGVLPAFKAKSILHATC